MILKSRACGPRQGHAAGRELLRELYEEVTGGPMPEIRVTDRGKPYFATGPWHFSISHTKTRVFCAISEQPVAIDAEPADRRIRLELAEKILSPMEYAQYERSAEKRLALLTFWVLKEAAAKYTGDGLQGYPNQTQFLLTDPRVHMLEGCLVAVIEEDEVYAV